ncbi:MAG: hypothetical protein ABI406_12540 [Ktedonobacteraceae bacterium]
MTWIPGDASLTFPFPLTFGRFILPFALPENVARPSCSILVNALVSPNLFPHHDFLEELL